MTVSKCVSLIRPVIEKCKENFNVQNANGNTPLHDAVGWNVPEAARILIDAGADICVSNHEREGQYALYMASLRGSTETMGMLLQAHIESNALQFQGTAGVTPLHVAAVHGLEEQVENILKKSSDVINKASQHNKTALHYAAERNWIGVVRLLVQHGAKVDTKDASGKTPLSWAAKNNNVEIAKILLENGTDPSAPIWERPLALLASAQSSPKLARLLLAHPNFDYTLRQQWGISGLQQAIYHKHNETALLFLERNKEDGYILLNQVEPNNWGHSPLHDVAQEDNLEMAMKLLETGSCELDIRSKAGRRRWMLQTRRGMLISQNY